MPVTRSQSPDVDARIEELQRRLEELQRRRDPAPPDAPRSDAVKARNPTPFSGRDPAQLHNFLMQASMVFQTNPSQFNTERAKIVYLASYLDGPALSWAGALLSMTDPPPLANDYALFAKALEKNFGVPAPIAAEQLRQLQQTGTVYQYSMEFRSLASRVPWENASLVSQFYSGLAYPIKAELIRTELPEALEEMIASAIAIDNIQQQRRVLLNPTAPLQNDRSRAATVASPGQRLTEQQRDFRRKNNLCLYCGTAGHFLRSCPARPRPKGSPSAVRVSETAVAKAEPQENAVTQLL